MDEWVDGGSLDPPAGGSDRRMRQSVAVAAEGAHRGELAWRPIVLVTPDESGVDSRQSRLR